MQAKQIGDISEKFKMSSVSPQSLACKWCQEFSKVPWLARSFLDVEIYVNSENFNRCLRNGKSYQSGWKFLVAVFLAYWWPFNLKFVTLQFCNFIYPSRHGSILAHKLTLIQIHLWEAKPPWSKWRRCHKPW